MMLGVNSAVVAESGSSEVPGAEESVGGGNRWPRQETLALLKIRSDMDVTFKDASLKGPLWEEVSRKMGELGFQRSAKKCKEKFENVYKYHKRTKDGRASKPDGKTYRFFDQLAALETTPFNHFTPPPPPRSHPPPIAPPPLNIVMPVSHVTVSSTSPTPLSVAPPKIVTNRVINSSSSSQPPLIQQPPAIPPTPLSPLSNSTSSSTSSDEDIHRRQGKKRKWKDYFERLMKDVVQKQEELQKKFLETLEKRERDRIAREEAWRVQEMARLNREQDRLMQERSLAAAKDAAVIAFLQKVTGENANLQIPVTNIATPEIGLPPPQPPAPPVASPPPPPPPQAIVAVTPTKSVEALNREVTSGDDSISTSSSRWPKAEVEALIKLRTNLELKYQDNGPKGPLWEEISKGMAGLGYSRNAKRCKEKWENINKYFKKVKESSKKRPEDSKTCPYFHQLDAIYKERAKNHVVPSFNVGYAAKPESPMLPIMARPEQQWPQTERNPALHEGGHDIDSGKNDHDDEYEDDEDDDEVGGYEIIANKQVTNTAQ
ncbi:hypothetical protein ACS0TY_014016 [Phlomoides rotata]